MPVRLRLFGPPTIHDGDESFALPFERRNQLLVYLALKRSWVGRAELATMLWPDQETKLANANLRKILFRLQSLPWARGLESRGGALRFDVPTDVVEFETALREKRVADALPLRQGELLAGFDDDRTEGWSSWLGFERERLRVAWRGAALDRLAAEPEPAEAIDLSARLLGADPLDEAALRAHMSWLARAGNVVRARQAYREFARRLADDLGLAPGADLQALHDSLSTGERSPTAPLPAGASPPDDGFVGRTVELRRIAELLAQDDCRLLCVIGPGGVGKTRLVRRAIRELAHGYADGATFVPLEEVASPDELGGQLARTLGVRLAGRADALDQVAAFLRERHMLLVLDNFEHLASGARILETLTRASARLRILVTSRVRLDLSTEWLLPLDGLPCPEPEDRDRIEAFDASRLFVQAARRVEPALIPAVEAASIVDICRLVDGLPLAIELAATWTRVLSCDAIAAELRQGTELLRAADGARSPRHASIDVVFDQSWRLLGAVERDALSRLSVFRGGSSAEAARAVAGASLPVLRSLADKSLLRKDGARLHMHPLVQQLAARRLGDGEARESTERAHALHFHRLLAQSRRAVDDGDRDALQSIDGEFENCRMAWHWAIAHRATDALTASSTTLLHFCDHRGRYEEGRTLFREALESQALPADSKPAALLLSRVAHLEYRLDRYADAEATARRALAAARVARDPDAKLQCFKVLGSCGLRVGRYDDARRHFRQALDQARASADPRTVAGMLDNLALVEKSTGRYGEALSLALQSLAQHRLLGDVAGEALCLNNLGTLHLSREEYESAGACLREGLAISERHGLVGTRCYVLANLAEVARRTDRPDDAEDYSRRALEVAQAIGNRAAAATMKMELSLVALRRGDMTTARSELADALGIATAIGLPPLQLQGVMCFADLLAAQGEPSCARRVLAFAANHPSTRAPERDEIRARQAQWGPGSAETSAWPGLGLDELVHRIVVETDAAHAPLIASIRGA